MPPTVRVLSPVDAERYRDLRLLALRDSPEAFASSYEDEVGRPPAHFAERLAGAHDARVWVSLEGDGLVGMVGLYRDTHRKLRHRGHVWGMFVRREARGRGHGRALLSAALDYARGLDGLLQVNLEVVTENAPALALYEALGFQRYGTERRGLIVAGRALDEALLVLPLVPFPR